ncbi:MAG: rod shape-determining protein MreC [Candidatus Schekmanbacteria bacterium]|nr:rod shape-determining protein MreC [Candidatus Schekmanbacteria bacterium]
MARKVYRKSKGKLLFGFILLALLLLFLPVKYKENPLSRGILSIITGSHNLIKYVAQGGGSIWRDYINLIATNQENRRLHRQLDHFKGLETQVVELNLENTRLRQLLGFEAGTPLDTLPAQVVGRDPGSWFKTVTINKGKANGVADKAAVVTHSGLIGHVIDLTGSAAMVLLITDYSSRVSVLIQNTRDAGILVGDGKENCHIDYLSRLAEVKVGDEVVTAGLGGIFPKGIKVGTVVSISRENQSLFQRVEVRPSVDLSRLEEVLVIKESLTLPAFKKKE